MRVLARAFWWLMFVSEVYLFVWNAIAGDVVLTVVCGGGLIVVLLVLRHLRRPAHETGDDA